jgi:N-formylmaleamate deformylase
LEEEMKTNWQQGNVELATLSVHYYRTGSGDKPPLVLAHGFSDNGLCWRRLAQDLQNHFDVIMLDARNHGQSGSAPASQASLVSDLVDVITGLSLEQVILIGHSMGAGTVAEVAAKKPDLISRIVLEDPPWRERTKVESDEDRNSRLQAYSLHVESQRVMSEAEVIETGRQQHPTWHQDDLPDWAVAKQQVRAEALSGLSLSNWPETLSLIKGIRCPSLLIRADVNTDGIITPEIAKKVIETNDSFLSEKVTGAGHNIRREGYVEYLGMIKKFLDCEE